MLDYSTFLKRLIKSLLKLSIGCCLLEAIKATYEVTTCILTSYGKLSNVFQTYTGIKQGAPSSLILFIIFMDDVIDVLKAKCINEYLVDNLHELLNADDTLGFSLDRESFIKKCNILVDAFHAKKLILYLKMSPKMIIQSTKDDMKIGLKLTSSWLLYKSSTIYLGFILTDSESTSHE